jgi:hypothetical protein
MFWHDSWQQFKPLNEMEDLSTLKGALNPHTSLKVKDLWKPQGQHLPWRQWKTSNQDLGVPKNLNLQGWQCQANRCKIPRREGLDILRWGYSIARTFTIKEAYFLHSNPQGEIKEPIWSKV